jgi:hypothetical protein
MDFEKNGVMKFIEYKCLADLPETYLELFEVQDQTNMYLTKYWYKNIIEFGLEKDVRLHIYSIEEQKSGMPLLLMFTRSPAGQNGSRYAGWNLGGGSLASLTNFQSSYYSCVVANDLNKPEDAFYVLSKGIAENDNQWHMIDINLMDPGSLSYAALKSAFVKNGYYVYSYFYKGNWYENFGEKQFSSYVCSRDKSSKKAIQNYLRKYRKLVKNERIDIDIYTDAESVEKVLNIYHEVYDTSWKEEDYFPGFYDGLIRQTAEQGSLRMLIISIDRIPAAIEMAIVTGGQGVMMRTAYNQEYNRESVGSIAILKMIEYVLEIDGVSEIDFGTDDDPYKAVWVKNRRERWGLVFFNRKTIQGNIYSLRYLFGMAIENLRGVVAGIYRQLRLVK